MNATEFAFLLTIWHVPGHADVVEVYPQVVTTGAACIALMEDYTRRNPSWTLGNPSCEPETLEAPWKGPDFKTFTIDSVSYAIGPCFHEDSENCYWDAELRGNGRGKSFISVSGKNYTWEK